MDLLFKNPRYFFETYFSFSAVEYIIVLAVSMAVMLFLCRKRFEKRAGYVMYVTAAALYSATLFGITLLNANRGQVQSANLNPILNIQDMFGEMGVHQIRGCLSNVLLFVPFGVFASIWFREHRLGNTLIAAFVASFVIELLQFVLHRGCAETMDVICNVLGAAVGAAVTVRMIKTKDYINKRYKE